MQFNLSTLILLLAFLIDIEGAIANDKISLAHMVPEAWIAAVKAWDGFLLYCGTSLIGLLAAPGAFRSRAVRNATAAVAVVAAALLVSAGGALASDLPVKAPKFSNPFAQPYTLTSCGAYFGINAIGSDSGVSGTTVQPGTQIVQGGIGGTLGYGCPINAQNGSFWFVEAMADITNLNGNTNGLSLSGPASFTERFGVGSPLNTLLGSLLPQGTSTPAVPNLPGLPAGITAGPGAPYLFAALHQDDISAQYNLSQNREWLLSWGVGVGILYRLSNGVVADTFAEFKANTQGLTVGPLGNSATLKPGSGAMVGVAFKY